MTPAMPSQSAAVETSVREIAEAKFISIPLNSNHRSNVLSAMLTHRFKAEVEAQFPLWADLADRVYDRLYDSAMQKKMKALPEDWLPEVVALKVSFGSTITELLFSGSMGNCHRRLVSGVTVPDDRSRRVAAKHAKQGYSTPIAIVLDATDELSTAYSKLERDHKTLLNRIEEASAKVRAALDSFNTTKQVAEAWPEAAPFLPGTTAARTAVAIPRSDLNKLLGLKAVAVPA